MNNPTKEVIQGYLARGGTCCLFCGSDQIDADTCGSGKCDDSRKVHCNDCERNWIELLEVADVLREDGSSFSLDQELEKTE